MIILTAFALGFIIWALRMTPALKKIHAEDTSYGRIALSCFMNVGVVTAVGVIIQVLIWINA